MLHVEDRIQEIGKPSSSWPKVFAAPGRIPIMHGALAVSPSPIKARMAATWVRRVHQAVRWVSLLGDGALRAESRGRNCAPPLRRDAGVADLIANS